MASEWSGPNSPQLYLIPLSCPYFKTTQINQIVGQRSPRVASGKSRLFCKTNEEMNENSPLSKSETQLVTSRKSLVGNTMQWGDSIKNKLVLLQKSINTMYQHNVKTKHSFARVSQLLRVHGGRVCHVRVIIHPISPPHPEVACLQDSLLLLWDGRTLKK